MFVWNTFAAQWGCVTRTNSLRLCEQTLRLTFQAASLSTIHPVWWKNHFNWRVCPSKLSVFQVIVWSQTSAAQRPCWLQVETDGCSTPSNVLTLTPAEPPVSPLLSVNNEILYKGVYFFIQILLLKFKYCSTRRQKPTLSRGCGLLNYLCH